MNRHQFLNDPDVIAFTDWLAPQLQTLPVNLAIPHHPRFVPGGVSVNVSGIDAVTAAYMWRSTGMANGNWESTTAHCSLLAETLRAAVATNDVAGTLEAAWKIIQWGGGHKKNGAYKFLQKLDNKLILYLKQTSQAFSITNADTNTIVQPVMAMNSMLTKVHAFLATDGLPIYDSRVAVAIATLVETWRQASIPPDVLTNTPIPDALHFPTVNARNSARATVLRRFPNAVKPKHIHAYNPTSAQTWSGAKLRLAWLMEALLTKETPKGLEILALPDRMRALEAALFMIGYDVRCLAQKT